MRLVVKKLYRSRKNKMIAGVCAGLAEYFEVDETIVRLGLVLLTMVTGIVPGMLFYIAASIIIPENPLG